MQNRKSFSLQVAGALALAAVFGTSAFADSRHQSETSRGSNGRIQRGETRSSSASSNATVQRDRSFTRSERSTSTPSRSAERSATVERRDWRGDNNTRNESRSDSRGEARSNNNQRFESRNNASRNDSRSYGNRSNDRFRSVQGWHQGSPAPYAYHEHVHSYGRVEHYSRVHGGYNVWIGGGLFPIFIPFAHWHLHPLHVGLYINFGGYWDPRGYWSVYDYSPYDYRDGYGYAGSTYTRGELRGLVESIDLGRGTMVVNDELSRQFVTVQLPRDRRVEYARPGDYIALSGDWTRGGVFAAYRVDQLEQGRY